MACVDLVRGLICNRCCSDVFWCRIFLLNLNGKKKKKEKEEFAHRQDVHSNQLVWKYLEKRTLKLSVVSYLCVDDVLMQGLRSLFFIYRFLSICIICFSHKEIKGKKKNNKSQFHLKTWSVSSKAWLFWILWENKIEVYVTDRRMQAALTVYLVSYISFQNAYYWKMDWPLAIPLLSLQGVHLLLK